MKKVLIAIMAVGILSSTLSAGMKYECWVYKDGHPWKMTYVVADNKSEAESKAVVKFKELGRNGDYIKCK